MTESLNKTITLIRKLLALAKDDGATEAEATLAMEKAQQLMQNANLSMAECEARGTDGGEGASRVKDGVESRTVYNWHKSLMESIAKLNAVHCTQNYHHLRHTAMFVGYTLIGRWANVASTRVMHEYLIGTIERVARQHVGDPSQYFTKYAHAFKEGCAGRIVERLQKRQEEMLAAQEREAREAKARQSHPGAATSNALVIVMRDFYSAETDLNRDFINGWEPGTTARRRAESDRRYEEATAKRNALVVKLRAENPDASDALISMMADGFSRERSEELLKEMNKPETPAQKRKRLEREEKASRQYWERLGRKYAKFDTAGHRAGREAAENISLDAQVGQHKQGKIA